MSLEAFFKHYRDSYSQLDCPGVTAHFTVPFTAIHHGDLACWTDMDSLVDTTEALLAWYRGQGFQNASHVLESVQPMGAGAASAVVAWTVKRDNAPDWRYHTGYHLKQVQGHWKIYGIVQYDTAPEQQTLIPVAAQA
ncbi:hypothetical protein [Chromobacterium sp. IIBBL 290-4]|uniref:hypothetical protein n=1 Tax=Chromobacterium sp. IIBBL 290-4 TaxID=2953890 RepID=UPI0020B80AC1|nr:hypothetical protein [Chromobacterium sp. IIBBL 290-4]UTH73534.1 hypothetical protein NKT35_18635 [Chromobacterium sp. IIBBL 290-4]